MGWAKEGSVAASLAAGRRTPREPRPAPDLFPIPEEGASARFRVYQYLPALEQDGFEVTVNPFCTPELFRILYDRGHVSRKLALGLRQLLQQCRAL